MEKFSKSEINKIFMGANEYFTKKFPDGVSISEIRDLETSTLKKFLKMHIKNLQQGKTRYNSETNKLRNEWFLLETIEKIMTVNEMEEAKDLSFCINSSSQIDKFSEYLSQNEFSSYSDYYGEEKI